MRIQSSYWFLFLYFFSSFFRLHLTLVSGQCLDNQKSLLLSLKNELKFDSSLSTKLVGWNQSGDCCGWGGVTCDKSGHVIGLDLNHESISGGFNGSSSLFRLKNLSVILLNENTLSSQIPESFANFQNLTVLSLRACNLSGPLPKKIFQVPTLKTIDLSSNVILKGPLPEFNGALETLVLSYTEVGGVLPDSIGNLPLLSRIELRGCKFTGPIPDSMRKLTRLVYVDLSSNHLTGSIPSLQGSKNLASLNLYQNNLTGGIPSFQGVNSLQFLDLSYNSLTGDFPESLLTLPSIEYVYLSNNRLSGQISGKGIVVSSYKIRNLDLSRNNFEGPIPGFIFKLPVLSTLMLSENNFNGVVDLETFGKFKELYALELSYNQLTVRVNATKSSISSLSDQLNTLKLASCKMHELPILKNHSRLMMLDLSVNDLTGEIPNWIWEVGNGYLRFLNLSHNRFSNLQKPYTFPFLLDVLDLHSNYLKGEIPVPPRRVYHLDYSSNNFGSSIPFDFGNVLRSTLFFSIAKSKVTGVIPQSIRNATSLRTLDLSHNTLTGPIPAIGNLKDLQSLDLSVNKLNGSIPKEIATLGSLSFLNVSYNHLSGKIPQGSKFQMFTELSFEGNKELCGAPLKKSCNKKRI